MPRAPKAIYRIVYQQPECEGEWKGPAKSVEDALKRSQINPASVLSAHSSPDNFERTSWRHV